MGIEVAFVFRGVWGWAGLENYYDTRSLLEITVFYEALFL